MKLGKLSLVAVMALGTSAFAIENVKVSGEVKVIYQTSDVELTPTEDATVDTGMFENGTGAVLAVSPYNGASAGGISGTLGLTADLLKSVSAGAEVQIYTTLGLENNVFNDNMINAQSGTTGFTVDANRVKDTSNVSQLWLATTIAKTTVKAGRMELDTPLVFTEKWNVAKNTFEAIVAVNNDIPDTTLIGAWVGKHNGHGAYSADTNNSNNLQHEGGFLLAGSPGRTVDMNSFNSFGAYNQRNGAYAVGAINKSIPKTTVQAWYFNVVQAAEAMWLQADAKVDIVSVGAQYATMDPKLDAATQLPDGLNDSKIWAVKGAVDVAGVNFYAAYSSADKDGALGFANVSTGDKTKIYTGTDSIYFDGVVTAPGVDTYKVGAAGAVAGVKLAAAYVNCEDKFDKTIDGFNVTASTNVGQLGLTAIYEQVNNGASDSVTPGNVGSPFYKGRDIDTLRLVASLKF